MLRPGSFVARLVAVAVLGILLLAAYQFLVQPLMQSYALADEKIVRSNELLERYRRLASARPVLAQQLAVLQQDSEVLSGYLKGPSDALAAAQLQDLAAEAIEAAGGEIRSTQILQATDVEDEPSVRKTGLKLRFATTIDGLALTLYDLETVEPHLFVDQLVVVSERGRRINDAVDGASSLDVRLDVVGYVRRVD
jgi:general secretion pathway protein M